MGKEAVLSAGGWAGETQRLTAGWGRTLSGLKAQAGPPRSCVLGVCAGVCVCAHVCSVGLQAMLVERDTLGLV